jgi:hypothetical protein
MIKVIGSMWVLTLFLFISFFLNTRDWQQPVRSIPTKLIDGCEHGYLTQPDGTLILDQNNLKQPCGNG